MSEDCHSSDNGHYTITVREAPENVRTYSVVGCREDVERVTAKIALLNPAAEVNYSKLSTKSTASGHKEQA